MALPTYVIELSFGSSGYIDVSSYVTSVNINRGSPRVLDDTQVGQVQISFINNDRTFDPFTTSSILYYATGGYTVVQPNAKVRVTISGIVCFTGWVQNWDFTNDEKGLDARASLMATDGLGVLARATFDPSLVTASNTATFAGNRIAASTAAWGSTAITVSRYTGKTPLVPDTFSASETVLTYLQNVARTEPFNFYGKKDGNASFVDRTLTFPVFTVGTPVFNYHKTAGWYNGTATDMSNWYYGGTAPGWGGSVVSNSQFPGEFLVASSTDNGGGVDLVDYFEKDATKYVRNQPYSLSFWTNSTDGQAYLYLKWVYSNGASTVTRATGSTAFTFSGGWNKVTINNISSTAIGAAAYTNALEFYCYSNSGSFQIKDLIITPSSAVPSYYFDGERYQQGSDYLNSSAIVATGWTGTERNSTSVYLTKTATGGTSTPLPTYESFADDFGQATFLGNGITISDLQVSYASDQFYNQINVIRASGGSAVKNDTISQNLYGIRSFGQGASLGISPARSTAFANEIYGQLGSPDYVLTSMDVQLEALTSSVQNRALSLELFDLARVIFRPSRTGSNIDKKYQIISINHRITPESHVISFGLAPFSQGLFLDSTYLGIVDTQEVV